MITSDESKVAGVHTKLAAKIFKSDKNCEIRIKYLTSPDNFMKFEAQTLSVKIFEI